MKVGFWTPYLYSRRGNATTARRLINGLENDGHQVEVFAYEEEEWTGEKETKMKSCDLFHILHFKRFSSWQVQHRFALTIPYVVTSGGTDINEHIEDKWAKELLDQSDAITVFSEEGARLLQSVHPQMAHKVHIVPQSVYLPVQNNGSEVRLPDGSPRLLLPAGIRAVKDVFHVIDEIRSLQQQYPDLQLRIVGEPLDPDLVSQVEAFESEHSWFGYLGSVPLEQMADVYKWADVVLNTSISEGQPIAVMEAMYYGIPVIVRSNGGNKSLIEHGDNGFVYGEPDEFLHLCKELIEDRALYERFSIKGKKTIESKFLLENEIQHYTRIYRHMMR